MSSLVRTACLTNFRELAIAAGLSPQRMLADSGLSPGVLDELDLKVPVERVRRLLESAAGMAGDESFALRMAEARQLSNLGPVGLLLREQPTLRASLDVLLRHHRLLNAALSLMLEESAGVAVLRLEIICDAQPVRQVVELALGVLVRALRQLLGLRWQPRRVCLAHAAPRDSGVHLRVFGSGVEFNQDFNGIVCTSADLDACNPAADPVMARYAQQLFDASIGTQASSTMLEEIRHAIVMLLPSGRCSIRQVSEHLGVACRTVQRRLAEQGEDFSSLVNEIRASLATRHLSEGDRPLLEVAGLLGFSAQSGFSRWHRDQFGCSPREWRATRQGRAIPSDTQFARRQTRR